MSRDIAMSKTDMFKTSDRASFLICFRLLQYYMSLQSFPVMCLPFSTSTFIATPSPEKKIAYQTFLALKDRLTIIGRLLCLVAKILLLTFLTSSN